MMGKGINYLFLNRESYLSKLQGKNEKNKKKVVFFKLSFTKEKSHSQQKIFQNCFLFDEAETFK